MWSLEDVRICNVKMIWYIHGRIGKVTHKGFRRIYVQLHSVQAHTKSGPDAMVLDTMEKSNSITTRIVILYH